MILKEIKKKKKEMRLTVTVFALMSHMEARATLFLVFFNLYF